MVLGATEAHNTQKETGLVYKRSPALSHHSLFPLRLWSTLQTCTLLVILGRPFPLSWCDRVWVIRTHFLSYICKSTSGHNTTCSVRPSSSQGLQMQSPGAPPGRPLTSSSLFSISCGSNYACTLLKSPVSPGLLHSQLTIYSTRLFYTHTHTHTHTHTQSHLAPSTSRDLKT